MTANFSVRLAKEHHVFSAAHFITFAGNVCERLHGHNYRVKVEVFGPLDENHYVIDFIALRDELKKITDGLDHRMLLPTRAPADPGRCQGAGSRSDLHARPPPLGLPRRRLPALAGCQHHRGIAGGIHRPPAAGCTGRSHRPAAAAARDRSRRKPRPVGRLRADLRDRSLTRKRSNPPCFACCSLARCPSNPSLRLELRQRRHRLLRRQLVRAQHFHLDPLERAPAASSARSSSRSAARSSHGPRWPTSKADTPRPAA